MLGTGPEWITGNALSISLGFVWLGFFGLLGFVFVINSIASLGLFWCRFFVLFVFLLWCFFPCFLFLFVCLTFL